MRDKHDRFTAFVRNQRGGTAVEFAIVVVVFLLLTLGLMDFARGIWAYNSLCHAVREGVRYAIVHGSNSKDPADKAAIEAVVWGQLPQFEPEDVDVDPVWSDPEKKQGSRVTITGQYDFEPIIVFFAGVTIPLSSTTQMVISY